MSTIGIISEYNPFHNGHKYLLDKALEKTGADYSVALMSGNFTQRGIPAMADKFTRAEAAVISGIDVVFELPVLFSTGSARDFATGAVSIFDRMKNIDYIAFGVENDSEDLFNEVADIIYSEPPAFKDMLSQQFSKGQNYAAACGYALKEILGNDTVEIISKPNNILAISYFVALRKLGSKIKPIIVKRNDGGYFNTQLSGTYSSATAIRHALSNNIDISEYVPRKSLKVYEEYFKKPLPDADWLTPYLASRLIYDRNLPADITMIDGIMDMTPELLNRLRKAPLPMRQLELSDYLKTKNLTMTRVNRVLIHLILGIQDKDRQLALNNGCSDYINLLALNKDKSKLLKEIEEKSDLEIINKKSAFTPHSRLSHRMWEMDRLATDFYNQLIYENMNIRLHSELSSSVRSVKL